MKIVPPIGCPRCFHLNPRPQNRFLITPSTIAAPRGRSRTASQFKIASLPPNTARFRISKASNNLASHTILEITLIFNFSERGLVDYLESGISDQRDIGQ